MMMKEKTTRANFWMTVALLLAVGGAFRLWYPVVHSYPDSADYILNSYALKLTAYRPVGYSLMLRLIGGGFGLFWSQWLMLCGALLGHCDDAHPGRRRELSHKRNLSERPFDVSIAGSSRTYNNISTSLSTLSRHSSSRSRRFSSQSS